MKSVLPSTLLLPPPLKTTAITFPRTVLLIEGTVPPSASAEGRNYCLPCLRQHKLHGLGSVSTDIRKINAFGEGPSIGIDLSTTYSCVGVWQHDRVEIFANDQGNRMTLSFVALTDSERCIGVAAKNQVAMSPINTIFGFCERNKHCCNYQSQIVPESRTGLENLIITNYLSCLLRLGSCI